MSNMVTQKTCLPTCLFIGPQKAGTSWIHEYFSARGDICLPHGVKETFFFDERFDRKGLKWYAAHFGHESDRHFHTIEVAPTYFQSESAPERIRKVLGAVPIVVTLREPAARSFSLYLHLKRYGVHHLPLREAVVARPEIVDSSRYAKHLRRWQQVFEPENVHVLFQEDLAIDNLGYVAKINQILGLKLDGVEFDFDLRVNEAATARSGRLATLARRTGDFLRDYRLYWPIELAKKARLKQFVFGKPGARPLEKLSDEDRKWLADQFVQDVAELKQMLGNQLEFWNR